MSKVVKKKPGHPFLKCVYLFNSIWCGVNCHLRGVKTSETGDGGGLTPRRPETDAL